MINTLERNHISQHIVRMSLDLNSHPRVSPISVLYPWQAQAWTKVLDLVMEKMQPNWVQQLMEILQTEALVILNL